MRVIVGISGASGAPYALELLRELRKQEHEVHAVASPYGIRVLEHECRLTQEDLRAEVHTLHAHDDLGAPIASGSFRCDAMVVIPCSMRSLAAIATGLAGDLLCRAADVILKERKNLVLAVRETPLNTLHLENMLTLSRMGVGIVPLCPGFYHHPQHIPDLTRTMAGRILDCMGIDNALAARWQGIGTAAGEKR